MTDYYSNPAISASGLKLMQYPIDYWDRYINQDQDEEEETDAMTRGSAFHAGFLEPHEFDNRYTVMPEGMDLRTKEGKQVKEMILASGKTVLKAGRKSQIGIDRIKGMIAAAHDHPVSKIIFALNPVIETPIFFEDEVTGLQCKMKPDILIEPCSQFPNGLMLDPKSCGDASETEFYRSVKDQQMYIQAAFYTDGYYKKYGTHPDFFWLAQECNRPYKNAYYPATEELLNYGRRVYRKRLNKYAECKRTNIWGGYDTQIKPMQIPVWYQNIITNEEV